MKKPLIYLLSAGLAVTIYSNTNTVSAEVVDSSQSQASISFNSDEGLVLNEVSDITFGEHSIAVDDIDITSDTGASLSVTDLRGTRAGWHVTAQLSPFNSEGTPDTETLPGAALNLVTGQADSTGGEAYNPNVPDGISLVAGGDSAEVVTAVENTGIGETVATWAIESTTLTVPGSLATADEHIAAIDWVLEDTPQ